MNSILGFDKLALNYQLLTTGCPGVFCRAASNSTFSGICSRAAAFLCGFLYLGWTDASVIALVKVKHKFQKNS
jgi:hypothetical protein